MNRNGIQIVLVLGGLSALAGCAPIPVNLPAPATPELQSATLRGNRDFFLCPIPGNPASCPALPTTRPTGWVLAPQQILDAKGNGRINRMLTIVVDTPNLTDLEVHYGAASGVSLTGMREVQHGIGAPRSSSFPGAPYEYVLDKEDRGATMRWGIRVSMNQCAAESNFRIFNVGRAAGRPKSAPLEVKLTAPGLDNFCVTFGGVNIYATSSSTPGSTSSSSGSCPGGGQPQIFNACETCAGIGNVSSAAYCSWDAVRAAYGFGPNDISKQGCTLRQVSSLSQCP